MQNLTVSLDGSVARVTLSRPVVRNAFDDELIARLTDAFQTLAQDPNVRCIVLGGQGPAFCAGADLNWMRRMAHYDSEENMADAERMARMLRAIEQCPQPVVARVHGDAYAGGVGLVAVCDIAVAADSAHFCLSEVRIGLIPATIGPYVIRSIGARSAQRYFLTAERFSATEAHRLGLIHEVVPPAEVDAAVTSIVQALCNAGPAAVRAAKRLIADVRGRELDDGLVAHTVEAIATIRASTEGKHGLQSFLDKTRPNWLS